MKKIEALIRPFELDEVRDNLHKIGIQNITVTDVRSSSNAKDDDPELYLGENYAGYVIEFMPKVKIEIFVENDKVQKVADAVLKSSREGQAKGHIYVYDVTSISGK